MAMVEGKPLVVSYSTQFVSMDQEVKDLAQPIPETRWCLMELPKEQLQALEAGQRFYFREFSGSDVPDEGYCALCTKTATLGLEFLENSNTILVGKVEPEAASSSGSKAEDAAKESTSGEKAGENKDAGNETTGEKAEESKDAAAPSIPGRCTVFAQCRGQLILKPEKVDVNRLRELLAPTALGAVLKPEAVLFNTASLRHEVAASEDELNTLLNTNRYVNVDGYWRLLPERLEREILDAAVTVITAMGWKPQAVDCKALLPEVQRAVRNAEAAVPSIDVLRKALHSVTKEPEPEKKPDEGDKKKEGEKKEGEGEKKEEKKPADDAAKKKEEPAASASASASSSSAAAAPTVQDSASADDDPTSGIPPEDLLVLDKQKMSVFRGLQILSEPAQKVRDRFQLPPPEARPSAAKRPRLAGSSSMLGSALQLGEFTKVWQELTDSETNSDEVLKILGNMAYVDVFEGTVHPLDATGLPREPRERLRRLFELQTHWRPERLAALIAPTLNGVKVDPWLLKNARQVFVELEPGTEERLLIKKFGI